MDRLILSHSDLVVFQNSFDLAVQIYKFSKNFPKKKGTPLPTRFGEVQDRFLLTLLKHLEKGDIQNPLFQN